MIYPPNKKNTFSEKVSKNEKGFTLIEIMVSVSIFTIIMTIGIGSLLSINDAYKRSRVQRQAIDSLSFVLDSMSRDIYTGSSYNCNPSTQATDCQNGHSSMSFVDQDGCKVFYELTNGTGNIERTRSGGACAQVGSPEIMTQNDKIKIKTLKFIVKGASSSTNDAEQPRVTVIIQGITSAGQTTQEVNLQTTVSQRIIDVASGS